LDFNFGYSRDNTQYGTSALTPGFANAGSVGSDYYTLGGSATYTRDSYYLSGNAAFDFSHNAITNNVDGGTGSTNGNGYTLGASAGDWLQLYGNAPTNSAIPTKAPPSPASGNALFLNLAGSVNYRDERDDGFTDTTGFIFGTERVSYTDLGAQAKLVAVVPSSGFAWMPFVGVSVVRVRLDRDHGFQSIVIIDSRAP
jgi:hypothetical protein